MTMSRFVDISPYENCGIVLHPEDAGFKASELSTADAKPVEHGRWVKYTVDIAEHPLHCSCCGWCNHRIQNRYIEEFKKCPNCGAIMDEEVTDE